MSNVLSTRERPSGLSLGERTMEIPNVEIIPSSSMESIIHAEIMVPTQKYSSSISTTSSSISSWSSIVEDSSQLQANEILDSSKVVGVIPSESTQGSTTMDEVAQAQYEDRYSRANILSTRE